MVSYKAEVVACCLCFAFITVRCSWLDAFQLSDAGVNADTLPQVAKKEGENKLVQYVVQTKLDGVLSGSGPFTLFGPNDEAFGRLPDYIIHYLKRNITALKDVLKYHVIAGKAVYSSQLSDNLLVDSYFGAKIRINIYKNGAITASGRPIFKPNVNASNGVLHEISRVMLPPVGDIVQTVTDKPIAKLFSTLVKAVQIAGLVNDLKGQGPITVFAPTNDAFSKLDPAVLDDLLKNKKKLQNVLMYHVVSGAAYSPGLNNGSVVTLNGQSLKITVNQEDEEVTVNGARVEFPDMSTTNGVIHVIDKVLMPPQLMAPPSFEVAVNNLRYDPLHKILRLN